MLGCREVARLIASDELPRAGLPKRITVRLHLMMCSHCARFAAQVRKIGAAYRKIWREASRKEEVNLEPRLIERLARPEE